MDNDRSKIPLHNELADRIHAVGPEIINRVDAIIKIGRQQVEAEAKAKKDIYEHRMRIVQLLAWLETEVRRTVIRGEADTKAEAKEGKSAG